MVQIIENVSTLFTNKNIPVKLKLEYVNQLLDIGYYAIYLGKFSTYFQEISNQSERTTTKLITSIQNTEQIRSISENIDLIEIPCSLISEIGTTLSSKNIILSYTPDYNFNTLDLSNLEISKIKIRINDANFSEENIIKCINTIKMQNISIDIIIQINSEKNNYRTYFDVLTSIGIPLYYESSIKGGYDNIIPTEKALTYLPSLKIKHSINMLALETAYNTTKKIFTFL